MPGPLSVASVPDLLRLVVVPVFAWAAYSDLQTRRVSNRTWLPLLVIGVLALALDVLSILDARPYDRQLFLIRVTVSLGLVLPMGYVFWRVGGFGGADAKALMTLAVVYPTFPVFYLPWTAVPLSQPTLGVFSLTILTNTVLLGLAYPLLLTTTNVVHRRFSPVMFFGRPVRTRVLGETYGRLLQMPDGFTRRGLDIDALRMYLRWRGTSLAAVRINPEKYRDPATIPETRYEPGDGARTDGGEPAETADTPTSVDTAAASGPDDPWGAATFLAEIEGDAYGTTPDQLRAGLDIVVGEDEVWLTPGIPFIVPMFVGLVIALTYGDILFGVLGALGLA